MRQSFQLLFTLFKKVDGKVRRPDRMRCRISHQGDWKVFSTYVTSNTSGLLNFFDGVPEHRNFSAALECLGLNLLPSEFCSNTLPLCHTYFSCFEIFSIVLHYFQYFIYTLYKISSYLQAKPIIPIYSFGTSRYVHAPLKNTYYTWITGN
jgi:hypothetical protein